jgi:hypothetical protein
VTATLTACVCLFLLAFATAASGKQAEAGNPEPKVEAAPEMVPRSWWLTERRKRKRLARYSVRLERSRNALRRTLLHGPSLAEAITLASIIYRVPASTLWRRVLCESHAHRWAHNASGATSYWQFLPSTWRSTPFGALSIYSTYAQALAAGWMMGPAGRSGEWVCR